MVCVLGLSTNSELSVSGQVSHSGALALDKCAMSAAVYCSTLC